MLYFNRNRYLAGNICFVLFLAFLFSLAFSVVGHNAANATANYTFETKYNNAPVSENQGQPTRVPKTTVQLELTLKPISASDFATIFQQLWFKLEGGSISQLVYLKDTVYQISYSVYDTVYGVAYYVYRIVYDLVYAQYFAPGTTYTLTFYDGTQKLKEVYLALETPPPEGGEGAAPTPTQETKTDFGTVAWDKEAGKGEAKVDAALAANLIQEAKQKGQATVDFRVSAPADVTLKTFDVEVPAKAVLEAVNAGVALLLGTTDLYVALDVARIPADIKAQLQAKPEAALSFKFNVLPEAEARQATATLPADYRVAGSVVTLELAFDGKALPGAVTLSYAGATSARSGLFAALDLSGLFRGEKLAAVGVDEDKLGVYRYNEATKAWEYVGGRVDKAKKTITAKLAALSLAKYAVMAYEKTFADLVAHWAKRDVEIMAARHIAGGVTENLFEPNGQVTRAQFAALLIRTLGIAETKPAAPHFKDVAASDWYYGAVETARAAGLVGGYPDGTFRPDASITREEIASMVHRALLYAGKTPQVAGRMEAILARFGDVGQIGGWAKESVAVAVSENILRGRTADTLVPKGTATRAEATVMLKRALVSLGELSE